MVSSGNFLWCSPIGRALNAATALLLLCWAAGAYFFGVGSWLVGSGFYFTWVVLWSRKNITLHCDDSGELFSQLGGGFWVTWLRVIALGMLIGILGQLQLAHVYPWGACGLYCWVMLLDAVDGAAARASGTVSDFGARLDNHTDALGMLAASLLAVYLEALPVGYLALSGCYLLFHAGLAFRARIGLLVFRDRMMNSFHNRYFAGAHMVVLALALIPGSDPVLVAWAGMTGLVLLLLCFGRDWLMVTGAVEPSGSRFGYYWQRSAKLAIGYAGVVARLALIAGTLRYVDSLDSRFALVIGLLVVGALGRSAAWAAVIAHTFGLLVVPLWAMGPVVLIGWLGSGACAFSRYDDGVYLERRFEQSGYAVTKAIIACICLLLSVAYVGSPDLVRSSALVIGAMDMTGALLLVCLNLIILMLLSARGYVVLRALAAPLSFFAWFRIRQVGFLLSYLTPGPQIGGEPVQVWLMTKQGVTGTDAVGVSAVDKLADLFVNLGLLLIGVLILGLSGVQGYDAFLSGYVHWALPVVAAIVGAMVLARLIAGSRKFEHKWIRGLREMLLDLKNIPGTSWLSVALIGVAAWLLMLGEWWAIWWALGQDVSGMVILATFLATRLALWTPVPGGLGVFEAGVVSVAAIAGLEPPVALGVCAVCRIRDAVLIGFSAFNAGAELRLFRKQRALGHESSLQ